MNKKQNHVKEQKAVLIKKITKNKINKAKNIEKTSHIFLLFHVHFGLIKSSFLFKSFKYLKKVSDRNVLLNFYIFYT